MQTLSTFRGARPAAVVLALVLVTIPRRSPAQDPEPAPAPEAPAPEAPVPTEPEAPEPVPEPVPEPAPAPTTGVVEGTVYDPAGLPFPNLTVRVGDVSVTTDAEGRFRTVLAPGSFSVTVEAPGLFAPADLIAEVAAGAVTTVDVTLQGADSEDYEVVVFAPEVVGGINASIDARREASGVAEVIGAEQMARSGDSQASVALSRVTGLTVVDGRFVFVRGLGDRYSSTLLNLSTLPSPEPERRVVPLDLFPTGLLESVTILKTWSPELPGDFGGGVVSMNTRGVPERPFNQVTATIGYTAMTTLQEGRTGFRGPTDFFGFGSGPRALPGPSARELALRVRAVGRRRPSATPHPAPAAVEPGFQLDDERGVVLVDGREVPLTPTERAILLALAVRPARVLDRDALRRRVWGDEPVQERTVDSAVKRLRARLGPLGDRLETVRGVGYRWANVDIPRDPDIA